MVCKQGEEGPRGTFHAAVLENYRMLVRALEKSWIFMISRSSQLRLGNFEMPPSKFCPPRLLGLAPGKDFYIVDTGEFNAVVDNDVVMTYGPATSAAEGWTRCWRASWLSSRVFRAAG